ncbi:MAG: DegV family protein [Bacilli bacterium]|nr:DegV family protein [Bacilli bacterium]
MKIAITAETTIDLPKPILQEYEIITLPFTVVMGEEQGLDGEIGQKELFDYVAKTGKLPHTAAVNVFQFQEFFREQLKTYDHVIHFSLSSKISAACSNAKQAIEDPEFAGKVDVIDTLSLSTGIALLAIYGRKLANAGKTPTEIVEAVHERIPNDQTSFVLETLDFLYKGGRCSRLAVFGANLLKLKPQILMNEGAMGPGKKYRGPIKKVIADYVEDTLTQFNNPDKSIVFITHTLTDEANAEPVRERLIKAGFKRIEITRAGGTIACHCGPNTLGILYLNDGDHE